MSNAYLYKTALFSAIGGFLFGYDTGVISGILITPSFIRYFYPINAVVQGSIVSTLIAGSFLGSLISGQLTDRIGRKVTILVASVIFIIGAVIQTFANSITMIYVGRFVAGVGVGKLSMVVPLYQSEVSSKSNRGRLVSLQQFAITVGIACAFWTDYLSQNLVENLSWRVPLGIQIIPGIILALGTFMLPYSPRWLVDKDRDEEAKLSLAKLRSNGDIYHPAVSSEYEEIRRTVLLEREIAQTSYLSLFKKGIRRRVLLGILIQAYQQLTGINAIMYYAPIIFQSAGLKGIQASLIAQGINGIINICATIPSILFVDRWGRRPTLILGAISMSISMFVIGGLLGGYRIGQSDDQPNLGASYTVIAFIYIFVASFSISWGPIGWIYPSEIFPLNVRSKAMSVSTASNWLFNYCIGLLVPILLQTIGYGLYLIFGFFCIIMTLSVYFFFPETKGKSLEEMDEVFGDNAKLREARSNKA